RNRHAGSHREQGIVGSRIDEGNLCTVLGRLAQALRHQWVVLAQEGTNHQYAVDLGELADRHAQPGYAGDGLVESRVDIAQAEVDIFGTKRPHQLGQQGQLFGRGRMAADAAQLFSAELLAHRIEAVHHDLQGIGPRGFAPLAVLALDHGVGQPVFGIQAFVGEAIAIADPAFVDIVVFERHHAQHTIQLGLHNQVGTQAIVRADRTATRHFPGAGRELEGLGQQCAHRTDVDHVAREFGLDRLADKGGDLGKLAAVDHADFHDTADLLAETDAARAVYATLHAFGGNERPHFLGCDHALFLAVTRSG